jgi:hypothetical protein
MKERNDFYGFSVIRDTMTHEPYAERPLFWWRVFCAGTWR